MQIRAPLSIAHSLAVLAFIASLLSGLRIASEHRSLWLADWLPQGAAHGWHIVAALAWLGLTAAYVWLRLQSPAPSAARKTTQTSRSRVLIRINHVLLLALLLSGVALYLGSPWLAQPLIASLHYLCAWLLLAVVLGHLLEQWWRGGWPRWRSMLLPSWQLMQRAGRLWWQFSFVVVAALLCWLLAPLWLQQTLPVHQLGSNDHIELDGLANDAAWQHATEITVATRLYVNEQGREIPVSVRALHNGQTAFFLLRWPDSTRSGMHLPLEKTEAGWRVMQTGFAQSDETQYYEDKLALMLTDSNAIAGALTAHLGNSPWFDRRGNGHARGVHASSDGDIVDVWHWKSVRNAGTNQLDDSHFGPPGTPLPMERRYTAGYHADPRESGGHRENWEWFTADHVTPKRLPKSPNILQPFNDSTRSQADVAQIDWGLYWHDTEPYQPENDHYPVGTRMPSVLWKSSVEGDRGDVRAAAHWQDGYWQLELARGLRAQSEFDRDIADGMYMWIAVFDHTQTRHSYHLRPLRLHWINDEPTS